MKLLSEQKVKVSAVSLLEAGLVLSQEEFHDLSRLLNELEVEVEPFNKAMVAVAVEAAWRYGRGRSSSKAKLNFGDCCVYATAHVLGLPLLFKGSDFIHTDIKQVHKT